MSLVRVPLLHGPTEDALGQADAAHAGCHLESGSDRDITTLANPDIVEKVREMVQGKEPVAVGEVAEDIKQFGSQE